MVRLSYNFFLLSVVFYNVYRLFVYLGSRTYSTNAEKTLAEWDKAKIELTLKDAIQIANVAKSNQMKLSFEINYQNYAILMAFVSNSNRYRE